MRMLCWHVDYVKWCPRHEVKAISEPAEAGVWCEVKDCVTVFTAFEKKDEANKELLSKALEAVKEVTNPLKVKRLVLYPYAHLSNELSRASFAKDRFTEFMKKLEKAGFEVTKSPFGWDKEIEIHCKGHPLAETLREL